MNPAANKPPSTKIHLRFADLNIYCYINLKEAIFIQEEYIYLTIGRQKHIALIAHDNKKSEMVAWAGKNRETLQKHFLCGTGTTARLLTEKTHLPVTEYNSGPLGGDQQIGSRIVEGNIDFVVFFWDPLASQPHDPDIKALLRISVVYDIPIATNRSTADFLLTSHYMDNEYEHKVLDYNKTIMKRLPMFQG